MGKNKTREDKVLTFLKEESYIPMKLKEIASILMVPKDEYNELKDVLDKLEDKYIVRRNKKNKYILIEEEYIEGTYKANEKGFGFVISTKDKTDDIFIAADKNQNALNGDLVIVEIIKEKTSNKREEGKIIKILKHEKTTMVGTFQDSRNYGFVKPDDKNFGTDIYIGKKNFKGAKDGQKVVVKILKYPEDNKNAEGMIIEVLGNMNDPGVDFLSIIKDHNLHYEFPEAVIQEASLIPQEIDEKEIRKRVDLRDKIIFTIDGEDAKDLDDGVRVEKLENGNYLLEVHIADVSHYVKENSLLDKQANLRGTSVYMLDNVIPMLPKELSNGICSLNEGKDRFTLSITAQINEKGDVVSSNVYKAVINVTKRMTYTNVQKILDDKEQDKEIITKYQDYIEDFRKMQELAIILKKRRQDHGYLNLDIPESKLILDKNGKVLEVKKYDLYFANEIIEQFMLTANEIVAEKFYWLEAPFIYRVHEVPDIEKIKDLNKFLFNLGYKIKVVNETIYPKEFSKILQEIEGKEEKTVISNLILRTLKMARYEEQNKGHFGIASSFYCHFTSPIRRYPDLFIHRIISEYLVRGYNVEEEYIQKHKALAKEYAKSSTDAEMIATKVERDSVDMKKAEYMIEKIGEEYEAIISNITSFGMFAELENTIEGLIKFENIGNEYYIYDEERKTLTGERTNKVYKIGNKIRIRVLSANKELRQIDFELVEDTL